MKPPPDIDPADAVDIVEFVDGDMSLDGIGDFAERLESDPDLAAAAQEHWEVTHALDWAHAPAERAARDHAAPLKGLISLMAAATLLVALVLEAPTSSPAPEQLRVGVLAPRAGWSPAPPDRASRGQGDVATRARMLAWFEDYRAAEDVVVASAFSRAGSAPLAVPDREVSVAVDLPRRSFVCVFAAFGDEVETTRMIFPAGDPVENGWVQAGRHILPSPPAALVEDHVSAVPRVLEGRGFRFPGASGGTLVIAFGGQKLATFASDDEATRSGRTSVAELVADLESYDASVHVRTWSVR